MTNQPLLALSVRQPFAELIMAGRKAIEHRSRLTHVRGLIFIYASRSRYRRQDEAAWAQEFTLDIDSLPRGLILGTVELYGCEIGEDAWQWLIRNPAGQSAAEAGQAPDASMVSPVVRISLA